MTDNQRYLFDLNGYLVLRNVLDKEQVARLVHALQSHVDAGQEPETITTMPDNSQRLLNFLHWSQDIRDLLDHPAVTGVLEDLMSAGYRIDHYYGMYHQRGTGMLPLHGGGDRFDSQFFQFRNGRMHTGLTVVSWALTDTPAAGGGFACVPGSHKSNYPLPNFMEKFHANELVSLEEDPDFIREMRVQAGDVIIFTEALAHAAMAWQADNPRWALLFKYCPAWAAWQTPVPLPESTKELLTPFQQSLFEPPYEDGPRVRSAEPAVASS